MRTKAEQMKFAFMDGGMVDSGIATEPTSGNKVPPGSLDDEVEDSVDAKLSEGEYVLPADVVQYLGLDKIEKMVTKAKEELQEMEANGRIGGEPVQEKKATPMPDDDLPLTDEELLSEDGELQMAEGGYVTPPSSGVVNKTYVGPNGQKRTILFVNGQPIQAIPEGFVPEEEVKNKEEKDPRDPMSDPDRGPPEADMEPAKAVEEWGDSDFEGFISDQKGFGPAQAAFGMLGGPIGKAVMGLAGMANNATGSRALAEVEGRLADPNISPEEKGRLEGYKSELEGFRDADQKGLFGGLGSKTGAKQGGLLGGLLGPEGLLGGLFSGTKTTSRTRTAPTTAQAKSRSPTVSTRGGSSRSGGAGAGGGVSGSPSVAGNPDSPGGSAYGGMAKGGLVKRRKK